jgi:hypothetical protein
VTSNGPTEAGPCARSKTSHGNDFLAVEVEVKLRPKVSRPVCLGVSTYFVAHDQIFNIVRHLWSS